MYSEIFVHM